MTQAQQNLHIALQMLNRVPPNRLNLNVPGLDAYQSVAVASAPYTRCGDTGEHYERCMALLYESVKALRIATSARIPNISIERVWPMYLVAQQVPPGAIEVLRQVIVEHGRLPGGWTATLDQLVLAQDILVAAAAGDPVETYRDFALAARNSTHSEGDHVQAVLAAATASEVLIKNTAAMLTWEATRELDADPHPSASVVDSLDTQPAQLIGSVLAARLAGSWQSADARHPVGAWRQHLARMRNKILHRGYRPTTHEADEAVAAMTMLEKHVLDRLASRANLYPEPI